MDIKNYLERVNFNSGIRLTKETLFLLQRNHLLNIPFENLDIHYGNKIEIDIKKVFKKIIINKRGGFCYELNSLFNTLLQTIGFDTFLISARVHIENEVYGQEFDHLAIVVRLENKLYLADVGFGKFTAEPLEICVDLVQEDAYGTFIIDQTNDGYYRVNKIENLIKTPEYIFKLEERQLNEFLGMCDYHQSSPDSPFTKKKVISMAKPDGRITLNNSKYTITMNGNTETVEFGEQEFEYHLKKLFDIQISKTVEG